MLHFILNLFFIFLLFIAFLFLIRNWNAITTYRLRQWQEESTKLQNHAVSGLVPFVDGVPGLSAEQREDLLTVIREKLRLYRAGMQPDQIPKPPTVPPTL